MLDKVYGVFGLDDYELTLSTRPEEFIGSVDVWDRAEAALREALETTGEFFLYIRPTAYMKLTTDKPWSINEGDGAFYGPKIDVLVRDNAGKQHQAATIQLDFQLPRNFDLKYDSENGEQRPVMIHRAIFGSLERFIALLIDHYQGKWPFWLNPRQAVVIPVAERHNDYAQQVVDRIAGTQNDECGLAAQLDRRFYSVDLMAQAEPVSVRIKRAVDLSYSFIILVGDREVEASTVALRPRGSRSTETRSIDDVRPLFHSLEVAYK
jgi:threonyl-tRNA synthetase